MIDTITQQSAAAKASEQSWPQRIARNQTLVATVGAALLLIVLNVAGAFNTLDGMITDLRFNLLKHPTSGEIVIVAMDQKSRNSLGGQSANREQHATVINNLIKTNAARIGMKFDFHAETDEIADTALLQAARMSDNRLVLPVTTKKVEGFNSEVTFRKPFADLAATVAMGAIRLEYDSDGHVHDYDLIQTWRDGLIPSFASEVVKNNTIDQPHFMLDFSIDPRTIPRVSYIDVLAGNVSKSDIQGKYVFVGSTEGVPGETISVPVYGMLSDIELHALAGEALIQNRLLTSLPAPSDLTLAFLIFIVLTRVFLSFGSLSGVAIAVTLITLIFGLSVAAQSAYLLSIPIVSSIFAVILALSVGTYSRFNNKSHDLFRSAFEARERGELMNSIINTNFDSVIVFDEQDRVYFINPMGAKMLNWTVEGALGRERDAILRLPEDFADSDNGTQVIETVITRADGNQLDVEMAITQSVLHPTETRFERRKSGRVYRIYTFRDISARKEAERATADSAERALQADRLKSEFIANMSHELRAPLNSIIGFSEVIKQELFGKLSSPHYKEYAEDIFVSGTHLMSIIDDLLEVSKIASGKVELTDTEIDMERMFAECLQIVRGYPKASKKVISASMRPGCPDLIADKRAVKQILINLLSNAIKFTQEGGGIRLSAAPSVEGGLEIMVSDDGIGIPPEEMSRITDAFHQIDHADHRKNAGTGLGLHIVQSLAELHGANVAVTSTVNSGTQVRVVFPPSRNGVAPNVIPLEIEKNTG